VGEEITSPPPAPGRSHPQLQLDNLTALGTFTYDGWQADVRKAEEMHVEYPSLFDGYIERMRKKQASHDGDRSHPQLQALDNLKQAGLTYIGLEEDLRKAEDYHVRNLTTLFDGHLEKMREKQALHVGDRSHPQLQALDNLKRAGLTYAGWEADACKAEDYHVRNRTTLFDYEVEKMRKMQALHVGDRSHPQLQALDSLKIAGLTYDGWEADARKAEDYHVRNSIFFDVCVDEMRMKQTEYSSQQNARGLPAQVSHQSRRPEQTSYTSQQNAQRLPAHVSPIPHHPRESDRRIDDRQNQMAEKQESDECVVCWSSKRTHAFFPCGHMCVCNECANTILRGKSECPLCRVASQQIIKIYQ
jgi:hypothetical protein